MKVYLQVHTEYSRDSLLSFEAMIATFQRRGIGCVAILEHSPLVEFS